MEKILRKDNNSKFERHGEKKISHSVELQIAELSPNRSCKV